MASRDKLKEARTSRTLVRDTAKRLQNPAQGCRALAATLGTRAHDSNPNGVVSVSQWWS